MKIKTNFWTHRQNDEHVDRLVLMQLDKKYLPVYKSYSNSILDLAKIETIDNTLDLLTNDHVNLNNINDTV